MPADPAVVAALEAALRADPSSVPVRLHLAGVLAEGGDWAQALSHLEQVLAKSPDHLEALGLAARAARGAGDGVRAQAWQRLHDALAGGTGKGQEGAVPFTPAPSSPPAEGTRTPEQPGKSGTGRDGDAAGGSVVEASELSADWDAEMAALAEEERSQRVMLRDVAGLAEVKQHLEASLLGPMRNPELRRIYGASMRGGLLLWGPPGCGKTFLARAVAGELGAHFAAVGLHDVLDMWLGNSEKKVHALFENARRRAPTVLFFDEVDAIGHSRADLARSATRNVVAQLLDELDGAGSTNDGVFVVGATNQPWDVDPALRRPGRFDRAVLVLPPDGPAREAIARYHLRDRPASVGDLSQFVRATEGFSGADLRLVCDEAAQRAMTDASRSGNVRPIGVEDLLAAASTMTPSVLPWLEMAKNFATYANTSGEYDELVAYLRSRGKRLR